MDENSKCPRDRKHAFYEATIVNPSFKNLQNFSLFFHACSPLEIECYRLDLSLGVEPFRFARSLWANRADNTGYEVHCLRCPVLL